MASIRISAKLDDIPHEYALTGFVNAKGKKISAQPVVRNGEISWDVPDVSENRSHIRANLEPAGIFACKVVHVEEPEDFVVTANVGTAVEADDSQDESKASKASKASKVK